MRQQELVALVSRLRGCLASIPARQKRALILRTGLDGGRAHSAEQVARILRVSDRRESQIEHAALTGLRKANAHSSCATLSEPDAVIASLVASAQTIVRDLFQSPTGAGAAPAGAQTLSARRPVSSSSSSSGHPSRSGATPSAPVPVPAAPSGGVISAPQGSGMDWMLLAVAILLLLALAAVVIARRRLQLSGATPAGATKARIARPPFGWPLWSRRPSLPRPSLGWLARVPRLSALIAGLAALPLIIRRPAKADHAEPDPDVAATTQEVAPTSLSEHAPVATRAGSPQPAPVSHPDASDAASIFALATALEERGDLAGAEDSYRRADALGHPDAAFHLGGMYAERGDFKTAEDFYRRADELGHADSAFNLGVLLEHRNDRHGAESAYHRAEERGVAGAAYALGMLLHRRGDHRGAEGAFRRADQLGDAAGAYSLGSLLAEQGDLASAEAAFRRADERGDAAAAFSLGGLLAERGDLGGAEAAFARADQRGHVAGVFNLGVLREERGDLAGAEEAYRRAEERGHGEVAEMAHTALLELWGRR